MMKFKNVNGIIGLISVVLWLAVFLPGLTINSLPYREEILSGTISLQNVSMVMLTYTITNVALLCCLAGIVGSTAKRITLKFDEVQKTDEFVIFGSIFSGVLRGFLIYLLLLAGVYAATPDPFAAPTPEQYVRMAGTISVLAFTVNYEPDFFQTVIGIAGSKNKALKEIVPAGK